MSDKMALSDRRADGIAMEDGMICIPGWALAGIAFAFVALAFELAVARSRGQSSQEPKP
jgi:hypothetical protein